MNKKQVFLMMGLLGMLLWVTSCSNTTASSEATPAQVLKRFEKNAKKKNPDYELRRADLIGKSAALFFLATSREVPAQAFEDLWPVVIQKISESGFFDPLLSGRQVAEVLQKIPVLNQKKDIYLDSLATVAVSDLDIARPLSNALKVDNLIVFQVDNWPCENCLAKDRLSIKVRIVNGINGDIIWTGSNIMMMEEADLSYDQIKVYAVELTLELLDLFYHRSKPKWHIQRYKNLSPVRQAG